MGNALASIGPPNARGEAMAERALAALTTGPRRPQRDLERLGRAWFTPKSCFQSSVPHAKPTVDGIVLVLRYIGHADPNVSRAAMYALECAATVCETGRSAN